MMRMTGSMAMMMRMGMPMMTIISFLMMVCYAAVGVGVSGFC